MFFLICSVQFIMWHRTYIMIWYLTAKKKKDCDIWFNKRNNRVFVYLYTNETANIFPYKFKLQSRVACWNHPFCSYTVYTFVLISRVLHRCRCPRLSFLSLCQTHRIPSSSSSPVLPVTCQEDQPLKETIENGYCMYKNL